jgi:hypothetical protein
MQFPSAANANPTVPQDFYAPNANLYAVLPGSLDTGTPASSQTQELSRVDQDFGTGRVVIIAQPGSVNFISTADKAGFLYLTPPPRGEGNTNGLGQFQTGDTGLIGNSGLSFTTQLPTLISRNPSTGTRVCTSVNQYGKLGGTSCDEIHELAYNNNLLLVWPSNETVEMFPGTFTAGSGSSPTMYTFGAKYDPCPGAVQCTGFPQADPASAGGAMAIAADNGANPPAASLWSIVPQPNPAGGTSPTSVGTLYAHEICTTGDAGRSRDCTATPANLVSLFSFNPLPPQKSLPCSSSTSITGWYATSFTEPSVAEIQTSGSSLGAVYVPMVCGRTDTFANTNYSTCNQLKPPGAPAPVSGVAVFTTCP